MLCPVIVKLMIMYVDLNVSGPFFFCACFQGWLILGKYNLKARCTRNTNIWIYEIT
jgi:hypothetical protein